MYSTVSKKLSLSLLLHNKTCLVDLRQEIIAKGRSSSIFKKSVNKCFRTSIPQPWVTWPELLPQVHHDSTSWNSLYHTDLPSVAFLKIQPHCSVIEAAELRYICMRYIQYVCLKTLHPFFAYTICLEPIICCPYCIYFLFKKVFKCLTVWHQQKKTKTKVSTILIFIEGEINTMALLRVNHFNLFRQTIVHLWKFISLWLNNKTKLIIHSFSSP